MIDFDPKTICSSDKYMKKQHFYIKFIEAYIL